MPVSVRRWLEETRDFADGSLSRFVARGLYYAYLGVWFSLTSRYPIGTNVFDREWEVLVVLDACRVDALRALAPEYSFVTDIGSIRSIGTMSAEWLANTFTDDHADVIRKTAMVTANGYTEPVFHQGVSPPTDWAVPFMSDAFSAVDADAFAVLDEVWKYARDDELRQVPPRVVTDHGIDLFREGAAERLVLHYLQPHTPYIANAIWEDRPTTSLEERPWTPLRNGQVRREEVWEMYLDNLRLVLDEVELLRENMATDAMVLTSDHGELFGEWGLNGHQGGVIHPRLRRVPWVRIDATDTNGYSPTHELREPPVDSAERELEGHLAALGYR
jgi:hypothetical protein